MGSLSGLLDSARSALLAHQLALSVTGNNIANVNTPGYSRQRLELGPRAGSEQRLHGIGAGVEPLVLKRVRQEWLDGELRREAGRLGAAESRQQLLHGVESLVGEPGNPGIGAALDQFWSAWADLANEPAEEAHRRAVLEAGAQVGRRFSQTAGQLQAQRMEVNGRVEAAAREINRLADQVAELNRRIQQAELGGQGAPALRDERDRLVDELSGLAGLSAGEDGDGIFRVWLGGRALVDGVHAVGLSAVHRRDEDGSVLSDLVWSDSGGAFSHNGAGRIGGLLQVRDEGIPARQATLDRIANALAEEVNALHRGGRDLEGRAGADFFEPTGGAAGLRLAQRLDGRPERLAASADGGSANGDTALAIAALAERELASLSGSRIGEAWAALVAQVGSEALQAGDELAAQETFLLQLEARRQSVSGVNLDEELTLLLQQEQAYTAASRVIAVADEMIQTVLQLV
jgi:flagellar hook-associated protein 1